MKLSAIAAVVTGAGIAQVAATPIRIITIVSGRPEGLNPIDGARFGHPIHPLPLAPAIATVKADAEGNTPATATRMRAPCGGRMSRFRQKGIEISNAFRQALGMPLIESNPHVTYKKVDGGVVHILPFIGTPSNMKWHQGELNMLPTGDAVPNHPPPPHHRHHHHHKVGHHGRGRSFTTRLHYSLMNLGAWEGRAVAFVLGCGIGVLLRMFWVLAIVTYRAVRGQREDEHEYSHVTIIEEYDADDLVHIPPPNYTYPIEKVAVAEEAPKAPVTTEESK